MNCVGAEKKEKMIKLIKEFAKDLWNYDYDNKWMCVEFFFRQPLRFLLAVVVLVQNVLQIENEKDAALVALSTVTLLLWCMLFSMVVVRKKYSYKCFHILLVLQVFNVLLGTDYTGWRIAFLVVLQIAILVLLFKYYYLRFDFFQFKIDDEELMQEEMKVRGKVVKKTGISIVVFAFVLLVAVFVYLFYQNSTRISGKNGGVNWKITNNRKLYITGVCGEEQKDGFEDAEWNTLHYLGYDEAYVELEGATNLSHLFSGNSHDVEVIDLRKTDTSKVTDMSYMFHNCGKLEEIILDDMDTSNVTNMQGMFCGCGSVHEEELMLDLSHFNTSNVKDMSYMFRGSSIVELDVSHFDTSNVIDMSHMFEYVEMLRYVDVSHLDTTNVKNMSYMFNGSDFAQIDVSYFDTSNVTDMSHMFAGMESLEYIDVSGFDTANVTDMSHMFEGMERLESIDVSHFDTDNVTDMSYMFSKMIKVTNLDIGNFETGNVTTMEGMFSYCRIDELDVRHFDTSNVTDMEEMFCFCQNIEELDVSNFDTGKTTNMHGMFGCCTRLLRLDLSSFDTSDVTDMGNMFGGCSKLSGLELSHFDTSNVTDMSWMFWDTEMLIPHVESFDTSKVTDMEKMFAETKITRLDLSNFNTGNVTNMKDMFYECENLKEIVIGPKWTLPKELLYYLNDIDDYTWVK